MSRNDDDSECPQGVQSDQEEGVYGHGGVKQVKNRGESEASEEQRGGGREGMDGDEGGSQSVSSRRSLIVCCVSETQMKEIKVAEAESQESKQILLRTM